MSVLETLRTDPNKAFKARVAKVAGKLPRNYRDIIYSNYPAYNTERGRKLIANVVDGRSPDMHLTEILEAIAAGKLKLKIKSLKQQSYGKAKQR